VKENVKIVFAHIGSGLLMSNQD